MYVHYLSHFMNVRDNIQFDACVIQWRVPSLFSPSEMNPFDLKRNYVSWYQSISKANEGDHTNLQASILGSIVHCISRR